MKRDAMQKLIEWKNSKLRKPLIVNGAMGVGKTWLMKQFGEDNYSKVAYISFHGNDRAKAIFDNGFDIKRIILSLQIESKVTIAPEDTLIILDDIYECPKALEALKYFCENAPEYHVIVAGSQLGLSVKTGISYPVDKVNLLYLYPLSFKEFLQAIGEDPLSQALDSNDYSVIDIFADKYLFNLKNYLYVGGMPKVVNSFVKEHDYDRVRALQESIIEKIKADFKQYFHGNTLFKLNLVFDFIALQLSKENKKFIFSKLKKGARACDFENSIEWLVSSGFVYKVSKVSEPFLPLVAYKDFYAYKLFLLDVGLLGAMIGVDPVSIIEDNQIFSSFNGSLAEQYVLQELKAQTTYIPYYFSTRTARYEQDFLLQIENKVVPVEVKISSNLNSPRLKAFYDKFHPEKSIRFSALPFKEQGWMCNYPMYAVCNLSQTSKL